MSPRHDLKVGGIKMEGNRKESKGRQERAICLIKDQRVQLKCADMTRVTCLRTNATTETQEPPAAATAPADIALQTLKATCEARWKGMEVENTARLED